jgi:hypothetical protein
VEKNGLDNLCQGWRVMNSLGAFIPSVRTPARAATGPLPRIYFCAGKQSGNLTPIMSELQLLGRNGQRGFLQEDCFDKVSSISDNAHRFNAH